MLHDCEHVHYDYGLSAKTLFFQDAYIRLINIVTYYREYTIYLCLLIKILVLWGVFKK